VPRPDIARQHDSDLVGENLFASLSTTPQRSPISSGPKVMGRCAPIFTRSRMSSKAADTLSTLHFEYSGIDAWQEETFRVIALVAKIVIFSYWQARNPGPTRLV
jgi:hypothetical protein